MPRELYEQHVRILEQMITSMARYTIEALNKAMVAFRTRDVELAKEVKKQDALIDSLQTQVEDEIATIIATQQPVATDLRFLLCTVKMAGELERCADHAAHLAKATKLFKDEPQWRQTSFIEEMTRIGAEMISTAAEAFISRSASKAREAAAMDDGIDHLHKEVIGQMLERLRERPEDAEKASKFIQVSGYLERLGDHMTNACEYIVYMVESVHVELNG